MQSVWCDVWGYGAMLVVGRQLKVIGIPNATSYGDKERMETTAV